MRCGKDRIIINDYEMDNGRKRISHCIGIMNTIYCSLSRKQTAASEHFAAFPRSIILLIVVRAVDRIGNHFYFSAPWGSTAICATLLGIPVGTTTRFVGWLLNGCA